MTGDSWDVTGYDRDGHFLTMERGSVLFAEALSS